VTKRRRGDAEHLQDALDHLRVLDSHLDRGDLDDVLIRDAVSHRLEVAIDAIGRVSPHALESAVPDDWPKIVAMRNMLAHQYADLDSEILQNTINNRLGDLRELITRLSAVVRREG
jgi:uncharacterized protein YutE (UPF0331/DUF86 family)